MKNVFMILVMIASIYFIVIRSKQTEKKGFEKEKIQYEPNVDEKILAVSKGCRIKGICICVILLCVTVSFISIIDISTNLAAHTKISKVLLGFSIIGVIVSVLSYWWSSKIEIVVTNKRVYGCAAFGKRVDLPLDSISAVGMSMFNGLAVGTSSGRILFILLQNRNAVHKAISDLLIERQSNETSATITQTIPLSNADELKKYKELLDMGVITPEEFDIKKKNLLEM